MGGMQAGSQATGSEASRGSPAYRQPLCANNSAEKNPNPFSFTLEMLPNRFAQGRVSLKILPSAVQHLAVTLPGPGLPAAVRLCFGGVAAPAPG